VDVTVFTGAPDRVPSAPARVFDSLNAPADPEALSTLNRATSHIDLAAAPAHRLEPDDCDCTAGVDDVVGRVQDPG